MKGQMSLFENEYIKPTKPMRVLVACEKSQRVCMAFRERGHEAYSCDIQEYSGGHPEWHIKGNVLDLLNPDYTGSARNTYYSSIRFRTCDNCLHIIVPRWDLIIAHPPCTHLCTAGQRWFTEGRKPIKLQREAISFFYQFVMADCDKIAIENPVGIMSTCYRKPNQIYNPYDFEGETECKKTCLWLKGLEPLKATRVLPKEKRTQVIWKAQFDGKQYSWNDPETAKLRSKTPIGVAKAMAEQWG